MLKHDSLVTSSFLLPVAMASNGEAICEPQSESASRGISGVIDQ